MNGAANKETTMKTNRYYLVSAAGDIIAKGTMGECHKAWKRLGSPAGYSVANGDEL
jgi:hypothetical protein